MSLHIPWDKVDDLKGLKDKGNALGLGFDAMNSNTFSDAPDQAHSYKFGSLSMPTLLSGSRPSSTISNVSRSARRSAPRR